MCVYLKGNAKIPVTYAMLTNEQQHQPITGHGSCCLHPAKTITHALLLYKARCPLLATIGSGHKPHQQSQHVPVRASISNSPRATTAILATGGGLSIEQLYCLQCSLYLLAVSRLEFVWLVFGIFFVTVLDTCFAGNFIYLCLQKLLPKIISTKINKLPFKRKDTAHMEIHTYIDIRGWSDKYTIRL